MRMQLLSLNGLTSSYRAWKGAVVFHMLPFTSFAVDAHQAAFEAILPRYHYANAATGETRHTMPPEYAQALELAKSMTAEEREALKPFDDIPWVRSENWNAAAKTFVLCDPLTVSVELLDENAPAPARAVALYMQNRGQGLEADWALFQQLIGAEAVNEWGLAYDGTRDRRMDAPQATQQPPGEGASPKASSAGRRTPKTRSAKSAKSRRGSSSSATPKA